MTVPQYHLPSTGFFRRIRTVLPLRPAFLHDGSAFCGTAIAVPYKMVERRGDSRIARRPSGAGKSPDALRRKNNRTSFKSPRHCEAAGCGNPFSFRPPLGDGRCFAPLRMRIATGLRPRNDAIVLNGTAIVSMPERLSGPKNSNLSVGLGGDQRDRTADLLNAISFCRGHRAYNWYNRYI